jgi:TatA/E family protein of Tat protein translocase
VDIGAPELLIILVIGLLIFGSNKLPKLARSLGQASREFKAATSQGWVEEKVTAATTTPPAATAVPPITTPATTTQTAPATAPGAAPTPEAAAGPGAAVEPPSDTGTSDSTTTGR